MICRETKKHAFTIPLWDHWASQLPPSPEVRTVAKIEGVEMEFWLRQVGTHLYFRPVTASVPKQLPFENRQLPRGSFEIPQPPTFNAFHPVNKSGNFPVSVNSLKAHFIRCIEADEWGIFTPISDRWHGRLICLLNWRGHGVLRFWWDEFTGIPIDLQLKLPFKHAQDIFGVNNTHESLPDGTNEYKGIEISSFEQIARLARSEYLAQLGNYPMTTEQRVEQPERWLRGNNAELQSLSIWIGQALEENESHWKLLSRLRILLAGGMPFSPSRIISCYSHHSQAATSRSAFLCRLAARWNCRIGHKWTTSQGVEPPSSALDKVSHWVLSNNHDNEEDNIYHVQQPSNHERLEAKLNLRDWLLTKIDTADVNLILNHPTGHLDDHSVIRLYHQYLS